MNTMKVTILMTSLMVLFMAIGYAFGGQQGMVMAFVLAVAMNFFSYWFSDKIVLRIYRAKEVTEMDNSRLHRIVKQVATKAMMPMPRVYVIPSKAPNAFATGRNQNHAAVAATEGIMEMLNDDELEGVMGHEMAHVRNKDMLIGTIAATFAGAIGIMASIARWGMIFGGMGRSDERGGGGGLALIITAIVAPIAALLIQTAISRQREYKADAVGGQITGKFDGLARALEKMQLAPVRLNLDERPATAHLMIVNPLSGKGLAGLFSTHPPVEERVRRLRQMATEPQYQFYAG